MKQVGIADGLKRCFYSSYRVVEWSVKLYGIILKCCFDFFQLYYSLLNIFSEKKCALVLRRAMFFLSLHSASEGSGSFEKQVKRER